MARCAELGRRWQFLLDELGERGCSARGDVHSLLVLRCAAAAGTGEAAPASGPRVQEEENYSDGDSLFPHGSGIGHPIDLMKACFGR